MKSITMQFSLILTLIIAQNPKDSQNIPQRYMNPILIRCGLTNTQQRIEEDMTTTNKFVEAAKTKTVISPP